MNPYYLLITQIYRLFFKFFHRFEISNLEYLPEDGCILAANHVSFHDPPAIGANVPGHIYYLARSTLWDSKIFGWFLNRLYCLPVDRDRPDMAGLKRMITAVRSGQRVLMFPEGSRSVDGKLQPAQPGMGLVVAKTAAPVVPIRIFGTYEAFPKGKKPRLFVPIQVVIGKPLYFDDLKGSRENYARISNEIMAAIAALTPNS